MHPYPHTYRASADGSSSGWVTVAGPGLPGIQTAPPQEFDGPRGAWSPETLLCAAVADCLILTFRGIARAAGFHWVQLECRIEGTLERQEGVARFTRYAVFARLTIPAQADAGKARSLLERAERTCLVSNSLLGSRTLDAEIVRSEAGAELVGSGAA